MIRICIHTENPRLLTKYISALENIYSIVPCKTMNILFNTVEATDLIIIHSKNTHELLINDLDTIYEITQKKNTLVLRDIPELHEGEILLSHNIGGYANANVNDVVLVQALEIIESENVWLYPELMTHIINKMNVITSHENMPDLFQHLSARENEVASLIARGESNQDISKELNISQSTVKLHVHSIFEKLHVKSRVALAILINQNKT